MSVPSASPDPSPLFGSDPLGSPVARAAFEASPAGLLLLAPDGTVIAVNGAFCALYGIDAKTTAGYAHSSFTERLEVRRLGETVEPGGWVTQRALRGERVEGVLQRIRNLKTGREFVARCGASPYFEDGQLVTTTVTVEDVTRGESAVEALQAQSARYEEVLRAERAVTNADGDMDALMRAAVDEATRLTGADGACLEIQNKDEMVYVAASGIAGSFVGLRLPLEGSLSGRTVRDGVSTRSDDTETDERVDKEACRRIGLRSMALVPLRYDQRSFGVLKVMSSRPFAFGERETLALDLLGGFLGAAVGRARVAEALARSAETFESLVRNSPFGVYVVDADFRMALVSQGAQRVFENVRPLVGRDFAEVQRTVWTEPFATETIDVFRRVLETGEAYHASSTLEERQDVDRLDAYDWKAERIALPDGSLGLVCHFYDLSERQRLEAELRDAKARTEAVLVSADVATWVLEVQTDRLYADRNLARFFDIDEADANGGPVAAYIAKIHSDDQARVSQELAAAITDGVPYDIEYRIVAKGEERWVTARGIPERDGTGTIVQLPGVVVDVTQLKRAQAALAQANRGLEEKVRERTADLQASNEALNGFMYHVAHDLRAPLRSIASTSRIVMEDFEDVLPEEAVGQLVRQTKAATKLGALIDDLLRLSKLSQQAVERAPIDFTRMTREVAEESLAAHPETTVRVEVREGLEAWADPRLLRLALGNLVENAVKYSPEGGTVLVGQHADGAYFVSDEGIGIDPRYFGKVFEPFQRLHADEEFSGTGIGLSNVKQVMERHGGKIWVESEPGKGSTFLFTLG